MGVKYYINRGLYTVRGFTPILSAAVVVALALAAVFGSMSLANPAMASIGQPADAELTERVGSPQATKQVLYIGQTEPTMVDISSMITGGGANYKSLSSVVVQPTTLLGTGDDAPSVTPGFGEINLSLTPGTAAADGRVVLNIILQDDSRQRITIPVEVKAATAPMIEGEIMDTMVGERPEDDSGTADVDESDVGWIRLDVSKYFMDGKGDPTVSQTDNYLVTSATAAAVEVSLDTPAAADRSYAATATSEVETTPDDARTAAETDGKVVFRAAADADEGDSSFITVEARIGTAVQATQTFFIDVGEEMEEVDDDALEVDSTLPSFAYGSDGSGSTTDYSIAFQIMEDEDVNTRLEDLVIEFHEDFSVPETIRNTSVAVTTTGGTRTNADRTAVTRYTGRVTFTPEDVTVDGSEVFISLGDMDERDDVSDYDLDSLETVTVHFRQSAGISNPTGAGDYGGVVAIAFGDAVDVDNGDEDIKTLEFNVPHSISIDPEDGGLGEDVTVKGKGFKNGTTLTVFRDGTKAQNPNGIVGKLDSGDDVLCSDAVIEDNLGVCTFEVSHPTFTAGATNVINAVDGVNATAASNKTKNFDLTASIMTSPDGGSPGEMILVQVVDFEGDDIVKVTIGGQIYCDAKKSLPGEQQCPGSIDSQGSGNFSIEIPNWARGGIQELKVWDEDDTSASAKITLVGPQIRMTSQTVIANQRVSLIGTGFSPGASIANVDDLPDRHMEPVISIGGDPIPQTRINDGDPVRVDNGGNWSASVDLPLSEATTAAGKREIRVRDSLARSGTIEVTVPDRVVTVTPDSGRVGTIALIEGTGFPSKNDEGSNFNVEIEYEAANGNTVTISALTDASGRFEQQMRIPTTAAIPSSNQIHVRFEDDNDVTVPITVPHNVPEGIIMPSETSGGPGSTITLSGEGFKSFVPVSLVKVGTLDVTPAPKPSTDGNGMMSFDIIIPGLDVGIQTIEVNVGRTTASVGFTVTESGVNPGDIRPVAEGLEELGENLDVIWHFNNDSKAWTFYDGQEGSTLTHVITGETYLILVKATDEVILNRDTRNLTCANGNCWNQIVW